MSERQLLVEAQKIKKILQPVTTKIKKTRGRAKKLKLKDLLKGENLKERINNFIDKLTVDDLLKLGAFVLLATLIYPYVYQLKPKGFWDLVLKSSMFLGVKWILDLFFIEKPQPVEFDMGCMAVSIITAYLFIYQGGTIIDIAKSIIAVL